MMLIKSKIKSDISRRIIDIRVIIDNDTPGRAIEEIVKVYEIAINFLYERYLGCVDNIEEIINYSLKKTKRKSCKISDCQFGELIGMLASTQFHIKVQDVLYGASQHRKQTLSLVTDLQDLNNYRIPSTHPVAGFDNRQPSINLAEKHFTNLKIFLEEFQLLNDEQRSLTNQSHVVNVQHLSGETQLYKSLNSILASEDIDCMDVTYFSDKLPVISNNTVVAKYWKKVATLLGEDKLTLRRVICVDHSNIPNKLLWIFFYLVPNYWQWLNQRASTRVFFVANKLMPGVDDKLEPVNLINIILMYNSSTPDRGHVWIFGGHEQHAANSAYTHLYGNVNMKLFHELYQKMFRSGSLVDSSFIKQTLKQRFSQRNDGKELVAENLENYVNMCLSELVKLGFNTAEKDKIEIVKIYQEIFSNDTKEKTSII